MEKANCIQQSDTHTCMSCGKKEKSLFDDLSHAELALLEHGRSIVDYRRGETIYKEGTKPMGLLCLNSGKVKLVRMARTTQEQIIGLKRPVDFIDVRAVITGNSYSHSSVALEDSSVCFIESRNFLDVVRGNPGLAVRIMGMFARELDEADRRFLILTQKYLRARLAEAILQVKNFYGLKPDGKTLDCELRRSDLAGLSNMNVANVIRTVSSFQKEGVIQTQKKHILIPDENRLKRIAAGSVD